MPFEAQGQDKTVTNFAGKTNEKMQERVLKIGTDPSYLEIEDALSVHIFSASHIPCVYVFFRFLSIIYGDDLFFFFFFIFHILKA